MTLLSARDCQLPARKSLSRACGVLRQAVRHATQSHDRFSLQNGGFCALRGYAQRKKVIAPTASNLQFDVADYAKIRFISARRDEAAAHMDGHMPDTALISDHEQLRSALYPLLRDRLDDVDWHCEDCRLFFSAKYFKVCYPTPKARRELIEEKRSKAEHAVLMQQHEELRELLFPQVKLLFDLCPQFRDTYDQYRLFLSAEFFAEKFPTAAERRKFIEFRRAERDLRERKRQEITEAVLRAWDELDRRSSSDAARPF